MNKAKVIHLPERPPHFVGELKAFGIEYDVVEGIRHEKGSTGVSLAFRKVIQENYDKQFTLIFEDDVKFTSKHSRENWDICVSKLPPDFDILIGGSYSFDTMIQGRGLIRVGDFSGLHCTLVSKRAYDALLAHDPEKHHPHIDRYLGNLSKMELLNVYLCDPMIAVQYPGYSHTRGKAVDYSDRLKDKNVLID